MLSKMDDRHRNAFLAFVLCIQIYLCYGVTIELSPKQVIAEKDQVANVTCRVEEKEKSEASEILNMKVMRKGGRVLVVLHPNGTINYRNATEDELTVEGKIDNEEDLTKSYLKISILEPEEEDAGMYICEVNYNVTSGETKKSKANALLPVKAKDVGEMDQQVEELLNKVKEEENLIKDLEQKEEQVKKLVPDLEEKTKNTDKKIKDMLENGDKSKELVEKIEEKALKQLKKIDELSKKEETELKSLNSTLENLLKKRQKKKDDLKEVSGKEEDANKKVKKLEEDVEKKTKQLEDLGEKEKKVEKKVNEMQATSKDALNKVKKFLQNKAGAEKKLKEMESKVDDKATKLTELQKKENAVETKMAELEEKLEQAINQFNEIESGTDFGSDPGIVSGTNPETGIGSEPDYSGTGTGKVIESGVMSAFAVTTQESYLTPVQGTKLILQDVMMQAGLEGYNRNTGTYTAPVDGLYLFSLTIKLDCVKCYTLISIKAGGATVAKLRTGKFYDDDQSSVSTVVKLSKGNDVFLYNEEITTTRKTYLTAYQLCVFTGHLIKQL